MNSWGSDLSTIFELITQEGITGVAAFRVSNGECIYLNRLAREVLEVGEASPIEGAPQLLLSDLLTTEDRAGFARAFRSDMLEQEGFYQDVIMRRKNGFTMIANVGVKRITKNEASSEPLCVLMFQDVTIQKKLQREVQAKQDEIHTAYKELLEQNKQLLELDQAKDKFLALTTHELRTPLSAIVATAEVLELGLHENEEQKEMFIKTIHEQGKQLMEIVNDILDFAKIRAGKIDFYVERVELGSLVQKISAGFGNMAAQNKVKIESVVASGNVEAWVDVLRMKEIIGNVVNNAIKYNRSGGKVTIKVEALESVSRARITVTDSGIGIPPDKIKHVFNEFETVGNVSSHHKGTGLGMPISKKLVQSMGGDLTLDSVEGVGTSFFIDIPTEKVLDDGMYGPRPEAWADLAA